MTDIHTHILPGIDDGAADREISLMLLLQESESGVNNIIFTPHFHPERQNVEKFCEKREAAKETLLYFLEDLSPQLQWKMGAEVFYSTRLFEILPEKLAIQGTPYILLEFSTHMQPVMADHLFFEWRMQGFIPIIAHVERYPYVRNNMKLLENWTEAGALIQVNAGSILGKGETARFVKKAIRRELVHLVASDTHSPDTRPANMVSALKRLPRKKAEELVRNGDDVFEGKRIDIL